MKLLPLRPTFIHGCNLPRELSVRCVAFGSSEFDGGRCGELHPGRESAAPEVLEVRRARGSRPCCSVTAYDCPGPSQPVGCRAALSPSNRGSSRTPRKHRAGYIRKDTLTHLSWASDSVLSRIAGSTSPVRLRAAYAYLLENNWAYRAYTEKHAEVLRGEQRRLPASSLLEPCIECAIWPVLYPTADWAESSIYGQGWTQPFGTSRRQSAPWVSSKEAFIAKLCSSVAD